MSAQLKEALEAWKAARSYLELLEEDEGCDVEFEDEEPQERAQQREIITVALEAAQQEAEARSTLRAWCAAGSGRYIQEAPHVPYIACIERGIERYESEVETEGEDVLTKAAAWCRAELAKS